MTTPADAGIQAAKDDANTVAIKRRNDALRTLANGYKDQLVEFAEGDQRLMDAIANITQDFIDEHLDVITDDDAKMDLMFLLIDRLVLRTW